MGIGSAMGTAVGGAIVVHTMDKHLIKPYGKKRRKSKRVGGF